MKNHITHIEDRRGGEPQRIGEILAELLAQYEGRFPAVPIAVAQTLVPGLQGWAATDADRPRSGTKIPFVATSVQ